MMLVFVILAAQEPLESGKAVVDRIDLAATIEKVYRLDIPKDARTLMVELGDMSAEFQLYVRRESDEDFEAFTEFDGLLEKTLFLNRDTVPPLHTGEYRIHVRYPEEQDPAISADGTDVFTYRLKAVVERARLDKDVALGETVTSTLDPEGCHFRTYKLPVKAGLRAFRVDVVEAEGDVDLYARRGNHVLAFSSADFAADTARGCESLIVEGPEPGDYYLHVTEPSWTPFAVGFTLRITEGAEPPAELLKLPAFPKREPGLAAAGQTVVSLSAGESAGSGTVVSADGIILTAEHVIRQDGGAPAADGEIVVAFTDDPKRRPQERFLAKVLYADRDRDLALLQVTAGLYGQPIPADYVFPHASIRWGPEAELGETIYVMGFPETGSRWARDSLTLAQGIVSGFDAGAAGPLIKTDARVHSGNSGGAAFDREFRLVGIPVEVVTEMAGTGQYGFLVPMSYVPEEWRRRLGGE